MSTINLVPSWAVAMDILLTVLEDGTPEGKQLARAELKELAAKVDKQNQLQAPEYTP